MYGIFTYIYPLNYPNAGKYTIHWVSGISFWNMFIYTPYPMTESMVPNWFARFSPKTICFFSFFFQLMVDCWFAARWFGIRIGVHPRIPIPFIRGFQESKPPGSKPTSQTISLGKFQRPQPRSPQPNRERRPNYSFEKVKQVLDSRRSHGSYRWGRCPGSC